MEWTGKAPQRRWDTAQTYEVLVDTYKTDSGQSCGDLALSPVNRTKIDPGSLSNVISTINTTQSQAFRHGPHPPPAILNGAMCRLCNSKASMLFHLKLLTGNIPNVVVNTWCEEGSESGWFICVKWDPCWMHAALGVVGLRAAVVKLRKER